MQTAHKRSPRTEVAAAWSLFCFVLALWMCRGPVPAAASTDVDFDGRPVTIHVQLDVASTLSEAYWLAGLSSSDEAEPDVLGLVWAPVPVGWFGSVWGLHLVSGQGLLPSGSSPGTGPLSGMHFYTLATVDPKPNHTYQATLSFEPTSGAVSVRVGSTTEGQTLVERGLVLQPYAGPSYPTPSETEENKVIAVRQGFEPVALSWRLVHLLQGRAMASADPIDRRQPVHLYIQSPWSELPGQLRLRVDGDDVGVFEGLVHGALFETVLDRYPAGTYEVAVDYLHQGEVVPLGVRQVQVGVVEARVEAVRTHVTGPKEITLIGDVLVQADGPVSDVTVSLDAVLSRVGLEPDTYGTTYRFVSEEESAQRILEHHLPTLNETAVNIPFITTLAVLSEVAWPYRVWEVNLAPTITAEAGARTTGFEGSVRLYAEAAPKADGTLRVMSYNIHHGEGTDGEIDLQRLADAIAYSSADIIGLQEVDVRTRRSMGVDQLAILAQLLRIDAAFGSNLAYQGGDYGNAVLSRYPIISSRNQQLPWTGGERRGLLRADVDVDGMPVAVYITHLSLDASENQLQRDKIADILRGTDRPFVLLGDMNVAWGPNTSSLFKDSATDAWLQAIELSAADSPLRRLSTLGSTFSSSKPSQRIDYIFVSDELSVRGSDAVFTIQTLASDHLPLVAELEWKRIEVDH